jgi:peptidoglycan/LPS O-acetylase OafA/YrhL
MTDASLRQGLESRRVSELDGLRGVAILLVVVYHYIGTGPHSAPGSVLGIVRASFRMGWSGVDLFFILSGFLIGGILLDARSSPRYFQTFYLRRVHRILPIYYLFVIAYALAAFLTVGHAPAPLEMSPLKASFLPIHLLFLQNIHEVPGTIFTNQCISPLWSLAVEEQFYLAAPLLIRYVSRRGLIICLITAALAAPLIRTVLLCLGHPSASFSWTPARADGLAFGMLVAVVWRTPSATTWLVKSHKSIEAVLLLLGGLVAAVAIFAPSPNSILMATVGFSAIGLFFAVLLLRVLLLPGSMIAGFMRSRLLTEFGMVSYAMYLLHDPINPLVQWFLRRTWAGFASVTEIGATLFAFGCTWGVARVSWFLLEKPMMRRGHTYSY